MWYNVPLEGYLPGQEWAKENLPKLRRGEAAAEYTEYIDKRDLWYL